MAQIAEMLRYLRKRENLTQEELSKKIGMSRSRISNYENGIREPDLETAEIFADFYNVDMNTLTGKDYNGTAQDVPMNKDTSDILSSPAANILFQTLRGSTEDEILQAVKIIEALKKG